MPPRGPELSQVSLKSSLNEGTHDMSKQLEFVGGADLAAEAHPMFTLGGNCNSGECKKGVNVMAKILRCARDL